MSVRTASIYTIHIYIDDQQQNFFTKLKKMSSYGGKIPLNLNLIKIMSILLLLTIRKIIMIYIYQYTSIQKKKIFSLVLFQKEKH